MKKIVGFGDMLVSFAPAGYLRFIQADSMELNYTGAEANVLVSLARFGMDTELVTRLPDNAIAECAAACMRKYNVGTSKIVYGGERIGVIYTERGASQRPSKVVYDRKHTSIATSVPEDYDWDSIFDENVGWFHFTGITAALSDSTAQVCLAACKAAKAKGITVSCDLNYRKNLWSEEKARAVMDELVTYVDVLIANEEDADKVLGIRAADTDVTAGRLSREGYKDVARRIREKYADDLPGKEVADQRQHGAEGKGKYQREFECASVTLPVFRTDTVVPGFRACADPRNPFAPSGR